MNEWQDMRFATSSKVRERVRPRLLVIHATHKCCNRWALRLWFSLALYSIGQCFFHYPWLEVLLLLIARSSLAKLFQPLLRLWLNRSNALLIVVASFMVDLLSDFLPFCSRSNDLAITHTLALYNGRGSIQLCDFLWSNRLLGGCPHQHRLALC